MGLGNSISQFNYQIPKSPDYQILPGFGQLALTPEALEQIREIRRQRRLEPQETPVGRVLKREAMRVERLPLERDWPYRVRAVHVSFFADERVTA